MSKMPKQKPGKSKQDYETPPEFLDATRKLLGIKEFDWDLAASPNNTVVENNSLGHVKHYTENDDALIQEWTIDNGWNWCNPPFANIRPWVKKAYNETAKYGSAQTAMLLPAGVGSNWWRDFVHMRAYVHFLNPRIQFVGTDASYPKDLALLLWSPATISSGGYNVWNWRPK